MLETRVFRGADIDSDHRLVIASFRLKLAKKVKCRKGKIFVVQCLKQPVRRVEYMEEVNKRFNDRKKECAEAVWKELKEAVVKCAEKHLQRRQPQGQWRSADNGACREEMPEVCTMERAVHECRATARVSDLVQTTLADKEK